MPETMGEFLTRVLDDEKPPEPASQPFNDLLDCPFCGCKPKLTKGIKVRCVNSQCEVMPYTRSNYIKGFEDRAIRDWNKRAI